MNYTVILLLTIFSISVHSQIWVGTYTVGTSCNVQSCCCLNNQLILTRPSNTSLAYQISLTGTCLGYSAYNGTATYPTGYSTTITILVVTMPITLSQDSQNLSMTSPFGSQCDVGAARLVTQVPTTTAVHGNAARQYGNIMLLLGLVSFIITMNL